MPNFCQNSSSNFAKIYHQGFLILLLVGLSSFSQISQRGICSDIESAQWISECANKQKNTDHRYTLFLNFKIFKEYARRIARISKESKLDIDEENYVESFKPHLMDVVHAWCCGECFASVAKKTDIFEGKDFIHTFIFV